jgi:hypothetical protein
VLDRGPREIGNLAISMGPGFAATDLEGAGLSKRATAGASRGLAWRCRGSLAPSPEDVSLFATTRLHPLGL